MHSRNHCDVQPIRWPEHKHKYVQHCPQVTGDESFATCLPCQICHANLLLRRCTSAMRRAHLTLRAWRCVRRPCMALKAMSTAPTPMQHVATALPALAAPLSDATICGSFSCDITNGPPSFGACNNAQCLSQRTLPIFTYIMDANNREIGMSELAIHLQGNKNRSHL